MSDSSNSTWVEHWRRVSDLFDRMQESGSPLEVAAAEPDSQVAADARRLWENVGHAKDAGFLDKPVELIPPVVEEEQPPQFAPGQRLLDRFEIRSLLGAGGMGEVYLAFDHGLKAEVAIKTIRAELAGDPRIRDRFRAEVQIARQVTHDNVCRIHDLFNESGLPFLSMEYLKGERLSAWLEGTSRSRWRQRAIALQLAEGLAKAHSQGILHCDFKPSNVILAGADGARAVITDFGLARAMQSADIPGGMASHSLRGGTADYMAPELMTGGLPSIRSDIYAYGVVLAQLLPGERLASRCTAAKADDRPASLDPVIRSLRGDMPRRLLLGGAIAAAAATATYSLMPRAGLPLAARTRIAIGGVRAGEPGMAATFRELLITALRQSTLLTVVADGRLQSLLKSKGAPPEFPAGHAVLAAVAPSGAEFALVIEGVLGVAARTLKATMDVFALAAPRPSLSVSEQVADPKNLVRLADQTALRLRREFGESPSALREGAGYTPLEQVTSASPEAVECYFRGMREHKSASVIGAMPWFDQAVRLDPSFALAWLQRGVSLMSYRRAESFESFERAFALRGRVTERERLWIETRCSNIVEDWDSGLKSSLRLVTLFPEEADFQRETAYQLTRLGRPKEALPYNQRAVELDWANVNNRSEWIVNAVTAGLDDEALALYRRFREEGETNMILNWGEGLALEGKDDLEGAYRAFGEMASRPDIYRYAHRLQCGPLILGGRLQEAISILAADLAWDINNGEQVELNYRRTSLGMLEWMVGNPHKAREHAAALAELNADPTSLQHLREAALLALLMEDRALGNTLLEKLREIERKWPNSNTKGARAGIEGALMNTADADRATDLLNTARGLRPDPLTLYPVALWEMRSGRFDAALNVLEDIERQRGRIHRMYFPGLSTLARVDRARCLAKMSRTEEALRLYGWVTDHWRAAGSNGLIGEVRFEHEQLMKSTEKGARRQ